MSEAESPHTTPSARERHGGRVASSEGDGDRQEQRDDEVQKAPGAVLYTQGEAGEADVLQGSVVVSQVLWREVEFYFKPGIVLGKGAVRHALNQAGQC